MNGQSQFTLYGLMIIGFFFFFSTSYGYTTAIGYNCEADGGVRIYAGTDTEIEEPVGGLLDLFDNRYDFTDVEPKEGLTFDQLNMIPFTPPILSYQSVVLYGLQTGFYDFTTTSDTLIEQPWTSGTFFLYIECEAEALQVSMDIKPRWSKNYILLKAFWPIRLVVYGSSELSAHDVDLESITLGASQTAAPRYQKIRDFDRDGHDDLVLYFLPRDLVRAGDLDLLTESLTLQGETYSGQPFFASDEVIPVGRGR